MTQIRYFSASLVMISLAVSGCGLGRGRVSGQTASEPGTFVVSSIATKSAPQFGGYVTLAVVETDPLPPRLLSDTPLQPIGKLRAQIKTVQYLPRYENRRLIKPTENLEWLDPNPAIAIFLVKTAPGQAAVLTLDTPAIRDFLGAQNKIEVIYGVPGHRPGVEKKEPNYGGFNLDFREIHCDEFEWCLVRNNFQGIPPENRDVHMSLDDFLKGNPDYKAKPFVSPHHRRMEVTNTRGFSKIEIKIAPAKENEIEQTIKIERKLDAKKLIHEISVMPGEIAIIR